MELFWMLLFLGITAGWFTRIYQLAKSLSCMPYVNPGSRPLDNKPKISIVIPMKNEETNARGCLDSLLKQDYPNFEIITVNDNSTDGTGAILKSMPVTVVENTTPTPQGWTGKTFAIHQGVPMASGDWLLFTDADTRHEPTSLSASLAHIQSKKLDFLTLLPRCLAESFWENLVQPMAMCFLGLWFPIQKINDPDSKVYFGNGQYLMIRREVYEKLGRHESVRSEFLEDFAFAKKIKENKHRGECALGSGVYGTRMYDSFGSIWRGWRRIYLHAFRSNPAVLLMHALETLALSVLPFIALFLAHPALRGGFLAISLLIWIVSWRAYKIVDAKKSYAFFHPASSILIILYLIDASWIALTGKKTVWR